MSEYIASSIDPPLPPASPEPVSAPSRDRHERKERRPKRERRKPHADEDAPPSPDDDKGQKIDIRA